MDDNPLPCPFCSGYAEWFTTPNGSNIACTRCGAIGPSDDWPRSPMEALDFTLDAWNTRYHHVGQTPTDRERWIAFLTSMGVGFQTNSEWHEKHGLRYGDDDFEANDLMVEEGNTNVTGYHGFGVQIVFHPDGSFNRIWIGE